MAVNSGLVTFPVSYSVAYKTSGLTIWAPQPPPGYAAMGCVANPGDEPPALTDVVCIATGIGEHIASWLHMGMWCDLLLTALPQAVTDSKASKSKRLHLASSGSMQDYQCTVGVLYALRQ